jgi:hypothetical protein
MWNEQREFLVRRYSWESVEVFVLDQLISLVATLLIISDKSVSLQRVLVAAFGLSCKSKCVLWAD